MSIFDWLIILIYFAVILIIGITSSKTIKQSSDFFLAQKHFGWFVIGLSIVATQVSAITFIGAPSWSYQSGLTAIALSLNLPLVAWILNKTVLPYFYELKITSVYQYIHLRFGQTLKNILVLFYLFKTIFISSVVIYIPSLILSNILSVSISSTLFAIVLFSLFYTTLGGIRSVILSDGLQIFIMWVGLVIFFITLFPMLPNSFEESVATLIDNNKLIALDFSFDLQTPNTFWAGLLGGGILHLAYYGTEQTQIQRILSAKNIQNARLALYVSSIIGLIQMFFFLLLGLGLYLLYQTKAFDNPNDALIYFLIQEIPQGLLGVVLVALFAATMSSIDSSINSMTTVLVKDLYEPYCAKFFNTYNPITLARYTTVFLGLLILLLSLNISKTHISILELVTQYVSYIFGSIFGIFCLGLFTQKANETSALIGLFSGVFGVMLASSLYDYFWMWNTLIGFGITTMLGYFSNRTKNNQKTPLKTLQIDFKKMLDCRSLLFLCFGFLILIFLYSLPLCLSP